MVKNCNAITKYADDNQTVDETTWGHAGYGEAGSGLTGRLRNKKVNKGGQTTIMSDSRRFRPRAYIHRHRLHQLKGGQTKQGTNELCHLLSDVEEMVRIPDPPLPTQSGGSPYIFRRKPIVCADNYFFDDKMCDWIGEKGFGSIGTTARNVIPSGIEKKYLHVEKHPPGCKYSKVAKFTNPIVAVKNFDKGFQRVHVSFQSTSSVNITTVNCLNECNLFVEVRERGRGKHKRYWGIEMNDARRLYLHLYWRIDVVDHLLKNAAIFYRIWKYWHAPMNHAFAMCCVLAHSLYQECCEGAIEEEWKVPEKKIKTFFEFREILSTQLLKYDPKRLKYPGDSHMRETTSVPKARRGERKRKGEISVRQFKQNKRNKSSRLCGDLQKLCVHVDSIYTLKNKGKVCAFCGLTSYQICGKCGVPLHYNVKQGKAKGRNCFYHYHDDICFGLGYHDATKILGRTQSDWSMPKPTDVRENATVISELIEQADL
jgi:hypothetical protein